MICEKIYNVLSQKWKKKGWKNGSIDKQSNLRIRLFVVRGSVLLGSRWCRGRRRKWPSPGPACRRPVDTVVRAASTRGRLSRAVGTSGISRAALRRRRRHTAVNVELRLRQTWGERDLWSKPWAQKKELHVGYRAKLFWLPFGPIAMRIHKIRWENMSQLHSDQPQSVDSLENLGSDEASFCAFSRSGQSGSEHNSADSHTHVHGTRHCA